MDRLYRGLKYLEVEQKEKMLIVWLNNPKKANALSSALMRELDRVLDRAKTDENVYLLIITGKGKVFSAGADIKEIQGLLGQDCKTQEFWVNRNNAVLNKIESFPKPVIAAINGPALGGGSELALACHFRFAGLGAKLGFPEIGLGIFPGWGGSRRLAKVVGMSKVLEMILTGKIIPAYWALEMGLVDKAIKSVDSILETKEFKDFTQSLIEKPQDALRSALRCITQGLDQKEVAKIFAELLSKECAKKGIAAFLEKALDKRIFTTKEGR